MFSDLFWLLALLGFGIQIFCCIYAKNKLMRFLPMLVMGLIMAGTVIFGGAFGGLGLFAAFALVWNELKIAGMMLLGYGLYALVIFAKK